MDDKKIDMTNGPEDLELIMNRIDEIAQALSGDNVSLEEALTLYEEGISLVRICNDKLCAAERKIKMLKISDDGEIEEKDVSDIE